MSKKATKGDIAAAEYLHVDADPKDNESPEAFKQRMRPVIDKFNPQPTLVIDSGNGLHLLWRLKASVKMQDENTITDIEARNHTLALALGADPSTRNIDRILRIPGTINYPNAKKRKIGRVECRAKWLVDNGDLVYDLKDFPRHEEEHDDDKHKDNSGSGYGFRFFRDCKQRGLSFEDACTEILEDDRDAGEWARRVDKRQLKRAWENANVKQNVKKDYVLVNAADIVPRPLNWLWEGHLLKGAQELCTGIKGLGKSQIQCSLVACATTGRRWPNGERGPQPGNIIMVTCEDTLDQVVVPRLILAGADLNRVRFLKAIKVDDKDRMFMLGEDLEQLEAAIKAVGDVTLVTIDPITAFMGKVNSSSPTEVRNQLGPLAQLAERTEVAITTITHPPKQSSQRSIDHFIGTQAFISAARIGHVCLPEMKVQDGGLIPTGRNLFTCVVGNHQQMMSIAYRIEEDTLDLPKGLTRAEQVRYHADPITAVRVRWIGETDITSDEAISAATNKTSHITPDEVDTFLKEALGEGVAPCDDITREAKERGISFDQLKRSRKKSGMLRFMIILSAGACRCRI